MHIRSELVGVDTINEGRSVILGRSRHDYIFCTSIDVVLSKFLLKVESSGLKDNLDSEFLPGEENVLGLISISEDSLGERCSRLSDSINRDLLSIDDKSTEGSLSSMRLILVERNLMVEDSVSGIILEKVSKVCRIREIVDSNDFELGSYFDLVLLISTTEGHTADTSETINGNFDRIRHSFLSSFWTTILYKHVVKFVMEIHQGSTYMR